MRYKSLRRKYWKTSRWVIIVCLSLAAFSCQSEYHQKVEQELARGMSYDSLFLGIKFGMTSKEFFSHCWELNKQGLIKEGPTNTTVEYTVDKLNHPAKMYFYPDFYQDSIYEMPVTYMYEGWAPWNKELTADSLQLDVLRMFRKEYGDGFMEIAHPERGTAYVRVDGNRRISIYTNPDDTQVKVTYTDLLTEKKLAQEAQHKGGM